MGAFGLNASIMDAANLAWKIGLCAKDQANLTNLGPTYDRERRLHALRIIHVSGSYLRFICNSIFPLADIKGLGGDLGAAFIDTAPGYSSEPDSQGPNDDLAFLEYFFSNHSQFLLGVDAAYKPSIISPGDAEKDGFQRAIAPLNGVRAPNPRVCFGEGATGYLYDKMTGAAMFHIVIFGSDLQGPVREKVSTFSRALAAPGFFNKFGKSNRFNILLVVKCLPFEAPELLRGRDLAFLRDHATLVFDDRAPDEDAHNCYAVDHARGAVVVVRPDLWVGTSAFPEAVDDVNNYFDGFLVAVGRGAEVNGKVEIIGFRGKDVNYST